MKISVKIIILAALLVGLLVSDGVISYRLMSGMGQELQGVVNKDVVLMQSATEITRHQLQKAVVFERARRIVEELAYQQTTASRREYLLFHVTLAKNNFELLAKEGAVNIVNAKVLVDEELKATRTGRSRPEFEKLAVTLKEIEKAHIHYDSLVGDVFTGVQGGNFELSADNLDQIHRDERKLSAELQNLIDGVQGVTHGSLGKAKELQKTSRRIWWLVLLVSLLIASALAISIIRSITAPLKKLVDAARRVGGGDLDVLLPAFKANEFGELSSTFNEMSRQLKVSKKELEARSEELRQNLAITDSQKNDLEKVNRELDRFVHTVSHDIRSPLMGIDWYAEHLKKNYFELLDQKGRDSLEGVCRGVDRCNSLIRDLLALTRIARIRNPYQDVAIAAIVDEVVANLEYKIKQNRVDLRVPSNLPVVTCDPIKIKEVFLNLMTNAIKFSSGRQDVQPRVEIGYFPNPEEHEFYFRDNGIGIDPKHQNELFTMFHRLENAANYEGTGAGLSIVKSIIDDHGGRVWVISSEGIGAEFHFTIPRGLETVRTDQKA